MQSLDRLEIFSLTNITISVMVYLHLLKPLSELFQHVRREVSGEDVMSLVKKPDLTQRRLAAIRSNGRLSRGPATQEGMERMRAANLRHGFYSQAQGEALRAPWEKTRPNSKTCSNP